MEADPTLQTSLDALNAIRLPSAASTTGQVPLSSIVTVVQKPGPLQISHLSQFPATTISSILTKGSSLGAAVAAIRQAEKDIDLPESFVTAFQGAASALEASLSNELLLVLAAIVTMYIVLGVLYESFIHPITILSTLPSAGVGALVALLIAGDNIDVIAIIGIILLIGIVKKNAIMMIDFALDAEREEGKPPREAIHQACLLRFRPILMTTMAALLGALPLMLGNGTGSELRRPLGVAIVGGLIVSQVLTLFTTPVIYLMFDRLAWRIRVRCERQQAGRRNRRNEHLRALHRRPVATTLLTIGIALAGIFAFFKLPVSPLPQVDFPTISVQASLPGASPETVATSVAAPLERHLGQIADVTEMTSTSSVGQTRIVLQFGLNRDINGAARDVQAAINAARADLPTSLRSNPTYRKVNPADAPVADPGAHLRHPDAAARSTTPPPTCCRRSCRRSAASARSIIGGAALPAVRVELNPTALFKYGIGLEDVRAALASANANSPKGSIDTDALHYQLYTNDQASHAADYKPLVVAYRNGAAVRLSDVADVVWTRSRTCATPACPKASRRCSSSSSASPAPTSSTPWTA